ncbi:DUF1015 domain-containing protein [Aureibaculum sp. 2210JD6-5]|uniref:DUF1015 domain-containing protein n=1 Tax=Aureibaculum sp. 2210JD6-5 TaxID=3103957 RepID=UPI002AACC710|nr:DUF1015 domain-containing protein [Aureibaculum sp. 2210JD6-5]MDY7396359.1 DUF1015 domain-containing protein [Aureibaculum sp. 2210JD6-5]
MAVVKPFCAVRATRDKVALVSSRSYDAYSPAELGAQLDFNPFSFLHIILPGYGNHENVTTQERFEMIHHKYEEFKSLHYFTKDQVPTFYIYKKVTLDYTFVGIIGATATGDYQKNIIKKHEDTLDRREQLFKKFLKTTGFNAEPVLLTYPDNDIIANILSLYQNNRAEYEFTTENHITHYLWVVDDDNHINTLREEFDKMSALYIADGHHRTSSSFLLAQELKKENKNHTGKEDYNYFMSYLIPETDLKILEFNRFVKDLNGNSKTDFLEKLSNLYRIDNKGLQPYYPSKKHHFSMYLDGEYYSLYLKKEEFEINDPLSDLDTQLLYKTILKPILGIIDMRNDKRLHYFYSKNGAVNLKKRVDSDKYKVAFGLFPVSIEQLKAVADTGLKMPPKSTYILPKLRSGLTIYEF